MLFPLAPCSVGHVDPTELLWFFLLLEFDLKALKVLLRIQDMYKLLKFFLIAYFHRRLSA